MRKKKQLTPFEQSIAEVFRDNRYPKCDLPNVKFNDYGKTYNVIVSQMYDFVPCGLKELFALAKIFNTDRFTIDQSSFSGCETCDYGSSYEKTFYVDKSNIGKWDIKLK